MLGNPRPYVMEPWTELLNIPFVRNVKNNLRRTLSVQHTESKYTHACWNTKDEQFKFRPGPWQYKLWSSSFALCTLSWPKKNTWICGCMMNNKYRTCHRMRIFPFYRASLFLAQLQTFMRVYRLFVPDLRNFLPSVKTNFAVLRIKLFPTDLKQWASKLATNIPGLCGENGFTVIWNNICSKVCLVHKRVICDIYSISVPYCLKNI